MRLLFLEALHFIVAVLLAWWSTPIAALGAGGVAMVEAIREKKISKRVVLVFGIAYLFLACFVVWRDEHRAARDLRTQLVVNGPNLIGHIKFVGHGEWPGPELKASKGIVGDGAFFIVHATISNSGAPSVVNDISLSVQVGDKWEDAVPLDRMAVDVTLTHEEHDKDTEYSPNRLAALALETPIPTGGQIVGMEMFILPEIPFREIEDAPIKLRYTDVTGRRYEVSEVEYSYDENDLPRLIGSKIVHPSPSKVPTK